MTVQIKLKNLSLFFLQTRVKEVHYSAVPIEYPKTSELGVATVYNITGWTNSRDCWKNVRLFKFYCYKKYNYHSCTNMYTECKIH